MALIQCPECGNKVSDQAKICPNCGFSIKKNSFHIDYRIFIGVITAVCLILLSVVLISNDLSPEEKAVKNSYNALKDTLLDPNSLIIYDCLYKNYSKDENYDPKNDIEYDHYEKEIMVYFYYGARNKSGGITEESHYFACDKNGNLIISASDKDLQEYFNNPELTTPNKGLIIAYWLDYKSERLTGHVNEEYKSIDQKEIEKL